LVKIGPVVLAEKSLTNGNCAATQLQFNDGRLFVMLAFENELEYRNSDLSILIDHQFSTLCEIFGEIRLNLYAGHQKFCHTSFGYNR